MHFPFPPPSAPLTTVIRSYVGRWLALELAFHCPQAVVVAFDVSRPSGSPFMQLFDDVEFDIRIRGAALRAAAHRVRIFQGSILSARDLDDALESCDVVFNAAAYGMASTNGACADKCHQINVGGTAALLDACSRRSVNRIVHVSSTVAVFDGRPIVDGTGQLPLVTRAHHGNHYGLTKALSEALLHRAPPNIRVVIVRPNGIFGPNDNTHFPRLKRLLHDGLFNLKVGDGKALVDWVFVDNLTHALLLAAAAPFSGSYSVTQSGNSSTCLTVHVSDEDPKEMNHLFCAFAEGLGYTPPSVRIPTALLAHAAALMAAASHLCFGAFAPLLTPCEALKAGTCFAAFIFVVAN
jgi:nucleoside-diphosphate-sugar epimerase